MERATHSRGRAPTAAQHKRQILTGSVEIEASLNFSPVLGGSSGQVCSRGLQPALRLRSETQRSKIERGLKPRDYILGLPFDSIMRGGLVIHQS